MKLQTKKWLFAALILILLGGGLFGGIMAKLNWDFLKLSKDKTQTNTYEISQPYGQINIIAQTADITFVPAQDGKTTVTCFERTAEKHNVFLQNDTLTVEVTPQNWYKKIGIFTATPKITLALPAGEYRSLTVKNNTGSLALPKEFSFQNVEISQRTGDIHYAAGVTGDLKLKTTTGHIRWENGTPDSAKLTASTGKITVLNVTCNGDLHTKVSTGKTELSHVRCQNLTTLGDTGDLWMQDVIVQNKMTAERSTGDVLMEACDAAELNLKTDTGDVKAALLTEKVFAPKTDTGKISVPQTTRGGTCKITTDTGDILVTVGGVK